MRFSLEKAIQRNYILFVLFCSCTTSVNQNGGSSEESKLNSKDDFQVVVELFKVGSSSIPRKYLTLFLNVDSSQFEGNTFTTLELREFNDRVVGLVYKINCSAGGQCERIVLANLSNSGKFIDDLEIGYGFADMSFSRTLEYDIEKNAIRLVYKELEFSEDNKGAAVEVIKEEKTEMFVVNDDGTIHQKIDK